MTVYETALYFYPKYWNKERIENLVKAGQLTKIQANKIYKAKDSKTEN